MGNPSQVDIILPIYNQADTLGRAIRSVLNQSFHEWRLFVINDGSTDDWRSVATMFTDPRIEWIDSPHQGVSAARNIGIEHGQAPYVTFLDGDDEYFPSKIEDQVRWLSNHPDSPLVFSDAEIVNSSSTLSVGQWKGAKIWYAFPELCSPDNNIIATPSVMLRRARLKDTGLFKVEFEQCEDILLWTRMSHLGAVGRIPKALVRIYQDTLLINAESLIPQFSWRERLYQELRQEYPASSKIFQKYRARTAWRFGHRALHFRKTKHYLERYFFLNYLNACPWWQRLFSIMRHPSLFFFALLPDRLYSLLLQIYKKAPNETAHVSKKKTILVITELFPNSFNAFLGTFVVRQLREIQNTYNVVVITTHPESLKKILARKTPSHQVIDSMQVYSLSYYPIWLNIFTRLHFLPAQKLAFLNKKYIAKKILNKASKLHKQYKFSLVHGHESYIGDEAGPVGQLLNIPSFFTLHGLFNYHQQGFGNEVMAAIIKNLLLIKKLIAVSNIASESYLTNGLQGKKFSIIPNGIEPLPPASPFEIIVSFAQKRPVILSVGFLAKEKKHDYVLQTLHSLHKQGIQAVAVIVGHGPEETNLRALTKELRIENHVLFLGQQAPALLPSIYSAATILLHPSVVDSFSMVCLEAMWFRLPVICTNTIGISEYTENGKDIIQVAPDDVGALLNATKQLLLDTSFRQALAQAGRSTAEKFEIKNIAAKIISLYE